MTPSRVVARAASALLIAGSLSGIGAAAAPGAVSARLDRLGHGLFPGVGHLLAPENTPWPRFVDPWSASSRPATVLREIAALPPRPRADPPRPGLNPRQRQDLGRRLHTTLPRYNQLFANAGHAYGLPASLLAAVAYIESKWRPRATHHRAAGMMMLSPSTARTVGVTDRLSAVASVRGGAHYLARMRARVSSKVPLPDRNDFALAAYNMGMGHLRDAQTLARRLGKNPHLWSDLKQVLPLLAEPRYYTDLPHGYARGGDVVAYVERVRGYQALIAPHLD
ncbi:transglycosylase SLT domain-containing protein [Salinisphaera sp. LB1]|uniref:transglycosylase SLT domain-containing protein n=1 Tax=Salinisphaera sp. LB1 TaxID=2183911 RepID=UPI000D706A51|nr:transglycosylase SLT domain-containing protein [Salinisphaera sp. LB1]